MASWWEVDPASDGNRRWSPYAYGNNNPVRFADPDGKESSPYGGFTSSSEIAAQNQNNSAARADNESGKLDSKTKDKKETRRNEKGEPVDEKGCPAFDPHDPMNFLLIIDQRKSNDPTRIIGAFFSFLPTKALQGLALLSKLNPFGKGKAAKEATEGAVKFLTSEQLAKKLGTTISDYHDNIKPILKKDFASEMKKIGTTNPDFTPNDLGYIVLKNPKTGKTISTNIPLILYKK